MVACALATSPEMLIAARFLRASFKGWEYCRDNVDACVARGRAFLLLPKAIAVHRAFGRPVAIAAGGKSSSLPMLSTSGFAGPRSRSSADGTLFSTLMFLNICSAKPRRFAKSYMTS